MADAEFWHKVADERAAEITRLRRWIEVIGQLPDIDADDRGWMSLSALRGEPVPGEVQ